MDRVKGIETGDCQNGCYSIVGCLRADFVGVVSGAPSRSSDDDAMATSVAA